MPLNFKHINGNEQILDGSLGTSLYADGSITADKLAIGAITSSSLLVDSNIDFNNFEALQFRVENLNFFPIPGNPGRLIWRTDLRDLYVDTDFVLNIVSATYTPFQVGAIIDGTTMSVNSTVGIVAGDAIFQGGVPFDDVEITEVIDGTDMAVDSTAGISIGNVITQDAATAIVTAIIDSTHLSVTSTAGFLLDIALVSTPFVITVVTSVIDATTLAVNSTTGFVGRATTSVNFGIVTVIDGTTLEVDNAIAISAGDVIVQGLNTTTVTAVVNSTHITVADTTGFAVGIADVLILIDILAIPSGTQLTVSKTTGFGPGDPITQGLASTTITSVVDGTHLIVGSTAGFTLNAAVDSTVVVDDTSNANAGMYLRQGVISSLILNVVDATHLAVVNASAFVAGTAFIGNWVSINDGGSVTSIRADGNPQLQGNITLASGTNVDLAQLSQTITVNVPAAGATGQLQFNDNALNEFGADSNLFWDNITKRLGIGNAAPTTTLDVTGNGHFSSDITVDTAVHTPLVTGTSPLLIRPGTDSAAGVQVQNVAGSSTILDVDTINNRVGINTSLPDADLHVSGTTHVTSDTTVDTQVNTDLLVSRTGDLTLKPLTDSPTAITVKNAAGALDILTLNTTHGQLALNNGGNGGAVQLTMSSDNGSLILFQDELATTNSQIYSGAPDQIQIRTNNNANTWTFDAFGTLTNPGDVVLSDLKKLILGNGGTSYLTNQLNEIRLETAGTSNLTGAASFHLYANAHSDQSGPYEPFIELHDEGSGGVEIASNTGADSYVLRLTSTTKGFLTPRMTTTQRDAIVSPAVGLLIYNTTTNQEEYYNGSIWAPIGNTAVAGANGEVQFNNNGVFGANANFFWDNINTRLGIGNAAPTTTLDVTGAGHFSNDVTTDTQIVTNKIVPLSSTLVIEPFPSDVVVISGSSVSTQLRFDFTGTDQLYFGYEDATPSSRLFSRPQIRLVTDFAGSPQTWDFKTDGASSFPGVFQFPVTNGTQINQNNTGIGHSQVRFDLDTVDVGYVGWERDLDLFRLLSHKSMVIATDVHGLSGGPYNWTLSGTDGSLTTPGDVIVNGQDIFVDNVHSNGSSTLDFFTGGLDQFVFHGAGSDQLRFDSGATDQVYFGWEDGLGLSRWMSRAGLRLVSDFAGSAWTWNFDTNGTLINPGDVSLPVDKKLYFDTNNVYLKKDSAFGDILVGNTGPGDSGFELTTASANSAMTFYSNAGGALGGNWAELTLMFGANPNIRLVPGGTGFVDVTTHLISNVVDPVSAQDAATKNYVDGGAHTVAGSDTQVQFNNAGVFGASPNLLWINGTSKLYVGGVDTSGGLNGKLQVKDEIDVIGSGNVFLNLSDPTLASGLALSYRPATSKVIVSSLGPTNFIFTSNQSFAMNSTGNNPDASALLDLQTTTQGFLPPRVTTTEKNAIAAPATGLTVYDTTLNLLQTFNGISWVTVGQATFEQEVFNITGPGNIFNLAFTPIPNSQIVYYNGLALAPGISEDYTVSGNVVTLDAGIVLQNGDKILIVYSHY